MNKPVETTKHSDVDRSQNSIDRVHEQNAEVLGLAPVDILDVVTPQRSGWRNNRKELRTEWMVHSLIHVRFFKQNDPPIISTLEGR